MSTGFIPPEELQQEEYYDPFILNDDGTVDLDLNGKLDVKKRAKFDNNVIIDGILYVQGVDILQEIQELNAIIGSIQTDISTIQLSLQS